MVTPDAGEIANAAMPSGGRSEKQALLQLHRLRGALGAGCTQLGSPKATSGKLRSGEPGRGALTCSQETKGPPLVPQACPSIPQQ